MPVCPQCGILIDGSPPCPRCGCKLIEFTQDDPKLQRVIALRPQQRPSMAKLLVLDDDSDDEGEWFRLRRSETWIGRRETEVCIPHDPDLSARHASIRRTESAEQTRWELVDNDSTNGAYVRLGQRSLVDGDQFRLGAVSVLWTHDSKGTRQLQTLDGVRGSVSEVPKKPVTRVGAGEGTDVVIPHPTVSPNHAEIRFDGEDWTLTDSQSLNGTWLKVCRWPLRGMTQFLLGQQRFIFHPIPSSRTVP